MVVWLLQPWRFLWSGIVLCSEWVLNWNYSGSQRIHVGRTQPGSDFLHPPVVSDPAAILALPWCAYHSRAFAAESSHELLRDRATGLVLAQSCCLANYFFSRVLESCR